MIKWFWFTSRGGQIWHLILNWSIAVNIMLNYCSACDNTVSSSSLAYITVQPVVANGSKSGRFWARSTASVLQSMTAWRSQGRSALFSCKTFLITPAVSSRTQKVRKSKCVQHLHCHPMCLNKGRRWCLDNFWKHNRTDFVLHTTKLTCTSKDYSTRGFWIHFLSFDCRWRPTNLSFPMSTKPSETTREICNITSA